MSKPDDFSYHDATKGKRYLPGASLLKTLGTYPFSLSWGRHKCTGSCGPSPAREMTAETPCSSTCGCGGGRWTSRRNRGGSRCSRKLGMRVEWEGFTKEWHAVCIACSLERDGDQRIGVQTVNPGNKRTQCLSSLCLIRASASANHPPCYTSPPEATFRVECRDDNHNGGSRLKLSYTSARAVQADVVG